jgi:predicted kinase
MGILQPNREEYVAVPHEVLLDAIEALRLGGEAILDRDWDCYSTTERQEAERFADNTFTNIAEQLERLLGA